MRPKPKYPSFYVSMKIMGKTDHSFLIDGGSSLNIISKVITEQLGLTSTGEARNMLTFNKKVQPTISQIKDLTLTLCAYPEVKTTCNFLVADMEVGNVSMILGHEWQYLTGGYLSFDESHITISQNRKSIIISREPKTTPYVENISCPEINFIETGLGTYYVFKEDEKRFMCTTNYWSQWMLAHAFQLCVFFRRKHFRSHSLFTHQEAIPIHISAKLRLYK